QGQLYHPLAHLVTLLPGYWEGHALDWNTAARLLALGSTHWVLFRFLRRLRFGTGPAFLLSVSTVYNLRALDMFRYGAAFEAWTGHLLLCCALGFLCLGASRPRGPLWVVAASYWLAVSGQPQMAYYGFLGAAAFALLCPFWLAALGVHPEPSWPSLRRYWLEACAWTLAGVLLAAPFWLPFAVEFLPRNAGRVAQSYEWSLGWVESPSRVGELWRNRPLRVFDSLVRPLRAEVSGNFGGSPLFLFAVSLPAARFVVRRIPRVLWVAWAMAGVVLLFAMGGATPVYRWAWETIPFLKNTRGPGRATLVLPVLFLTIGGWLLRPNSARSALRHPGGCAVACALGLLLVRGLLPSSPPDPFSPLAIRRPPVGVEPLLLVLAVGGLLALLVYLRRRSRTALAGTCAAFLVYLGLLLAYGTWIVPRAPSRTWAQLAAAHARDPRAFVTAGYGLYTHEAKEQYERAFLEPYLARVVTRGVAVASPAEAFAKMHKELRPDLAYVTSSEPLPAPRPGPRRAAPPEVRTAFATVNRLVFAVRSPVPGYLLTGLLAFPNWEARVDGRLARTVKANGHQLAVPVPAGESRVELSYRSPASLAGVLLGVAVFLGLGVYACASLRRVGRWPWLLFCALLGAACVPVVVRLQTGRDLGSRVEWTPARGPLASLAYGKRLRASSVLPAEQTHLVCPSLAVDGAVGFFGATTGAEPAPYFELDLGAPKAVRRVRGHEALANPFLEVRIFAPLESSGGEARGLPLLNRRPLRLSGSLDGRRYFELGTISQVPRPEGWELRLPRPVRLRYLRVVAGAPCRLAFRELQVFSD
ncbi:MAG: hypothetical protein D6731_03465, partial [Planctomycetota bacterium]